MQKIALYCSAEKGCYHCGLCPHSCTLSSGQTGLCGVRTAYESGIFSENYALVTAMALDPIEKKPLYHFYPGTKILSIGSAGCNLRCCFCQNHEISQANPGGKTILPEEMVNQAGKNGSIGVAYTYNEPSIWFEFVLDCSRLVRKAGLKNVLVTNGYISSEPLEEIIGCIDAMNIDLKSMNHETYRKICGGELDPVLQTIRRASELTHLEVTHLVVPEVNDRIEEFDLLLDFMKELKGNPVLHISRYHPGFQYHKPATDISVLNKFYCRAKERLSFVYLGNVSDSRASSTTCPSCGKIVIERSGYQITNLMNSSNCPECGRQISGVFQ
ncbi:MAG: AmmeMemoRadiSam system radical SAM enzyme [Candidatus Wallbacteria bacterium]|nr:AmmeMemoRadiSam system radical SAM enzyme [Candidatus Wallbacteria bacterium]